MEKVKAKRCVAQGDVMFKRIDSLPQIEKTREPEREADGALVVAHSETGHHHVIEASDARLIETGDPLIAYLVAGSADVDVVHRRSFDTHPTVSLEGGGTMGKDAVWKVIRQREMSPSGWVRAAD